MVIVQPIAMRIKRTHSYKIGTNQRHGNSVKDGFATCLIERNFPLLNYCSDKIQQLFKLVWGWENEKLLYLENFSICFSLNASQTLECVRAKLQTTIFG